MSFDFNTIQFNDTDETEFGQIEDSSQLVELLGEYQTGIYTFHGMQTEFRKALVNDPEAMLQYCKEQLEGRNIHGHYIVDLTKVTQCKHNQVILGHGTSGINLQLILEYKYRLFQKNAVFIVKASVDHIDKIASYGDDIPVYGEHHKELSGFMTVKNKTVQAKKLLNLLSTEYVKKGMAFPVEIYSFEMKANSRDIIAVVQPVLPKKPLAFHLVDNPPSDGRGWTDLQNKIDVEAAPGTDFRKTLSKVQGLMALYQDIDLVEFDLKRGDGFLYDTIGASFGELPGAGTGAGDGLDGLNDSSGDIKTVGINWETLVELVYSSYASLFNLTTHFSNVGLKDKYLVEFAKAKA